VSDEASAAESIEAPGFLSEHDRLQRLAAARSDVISFAGGLPDAGLFPRRALIRAFIATVQRPSCQALQYGWPEGLLGLRRYVAERLAERGAHVDPSHVVITSGAQQAISLSLHAALRAGGSVGFEPESYPGALDAARAFGAKLVSLEDAAHAYYVMPSLSNPRGQPIARSLRQGLLERARRHRASIIEDDAYADTVFSGRPSRPLLADAPERVFQIGTFSKILCPGLRVGWVVAPERYLRRVLRAKQNNDLQANGLSQSLLEAYLEQGTFEALKARSRRSYKRRAERLSDAVRRYLPEFRFEEPSGGFSLWLESDLRLRDDLLFDAALREGVSFDVGTAFRRAPGGPLALRLSYSSVAEEEIVEGTQRLARALRNLHAEGTSERPRTS
jgi:2-aminoadipate transaminase